MLELALVARSVTPPLDVTPLTEPRSSERLLIVNELDAALISESEPEVLLAARFVRLLLESKVTVPVPRIIKSEVLVARLKAAFCVIPLANKVNIPGANVALGVKLPIVIAPVLLSPILTSVARILLSSACVKSSVPDVPSAILIVPPLVLGVIIARVAEPVFNALPPICDVAPVSITMLSPIKLICPVVSNSEPEFVVNVPLPAFTDNIPELA